MTINMDWVLTSIHTAFARSKEKAGGEEHTSGSRPSTKEKHEAGQRRQRTDRGGEKGDERRRPPRRRPKGHKGPWPPTNGTVAADFEDDSSASVPLYGLWGMPTPVPRSEGEGTGDEYGDRFYFQLGSWRGQ